MKYREIKKTGDKVSLMGLGAMRLPKNADGSVDRPHAIKMIRKAIDNGVNYIDTAYTYHGQTSESVVAEALRDGYREKVFIADKHPVWLANSEEEMKAIFYEQLERLETDCIDFYLIHNLTRGIWATAQKFNTFEFLTEMKKEGKIKYLGFSFHDDLECFKEIIDAKPWDFCQIQLNYMDKEFQAGVEGMKYAYERDIPVIIMEPVKGGRLAAHMHPAKVLTFALSDVPGSRPDVIASGPTQADRFPDEEFYRIVDRYHLNIDGVLNNIPPKAELPEDTHFRVVGDMRMLCLYAGKEAENRGYTFYPLQDMLNDDAEVVAGGTIRSALSFTEHCIGKRAYICGGEPSVCVRGKGKGGRSQQAALRAALELDGIKNVVFLAGGSDGTDGPTDAAGGIVDGRTAAKMRRNGIDAELYLANNNAYPALQSSGALLMTGPTGTNVNDLFILLIEKEIPCNP